MMIFVLWLLDISTLYFSIIALNSNFLLQKIGKHKIYLHITLIYFAFIGYTTGICKHNMFLRPFEQ